MKACSIEGCARPAKCRGWCMRHYNRWVCHKDPLFIKDTSRPPLERFMEKVRVNAETGCWEWIGHVAPTGYGTFKVNDKLRGPAHRRGWELLRGPVPDGLQLDHLCRVKHCVNPDHLEPVTQSTNMRRVYESRGVCGQGLHPYEYSENRQRRGCRQCCNDRERRQRAESARVSSAEAA